MSSVNATGNGDACDGAKPPSAAERVRALRTETHECLAELESSSIASERAASVVHGSYRSSAPPSPVSIRSTHSESLSALAPRGSERAHATTDSARVDRLSSSDNVDARLCQRAGQPHSSAHSSLELSPASSARCERRASFASNSTKQPRSSASDRFVLPRSRLQTTERGYRTAYTDANAWCRTSRSPWTAHEPLATADAVAGAATRYEPRPVVSAADALCVAQAAAREFLGTNLQIKIARPGSSGRSPCAKASVDASNAAPVPHARTTATGLPTQDPPVATGARATRDEAIQTDDVNEAVAIHQRLQDKRPSPIVTAKDLTMRGTRSAARQSTRSSPSASLVHNRSASAPSPQQQQQQQQSATQGLAQSSPSSSTSSVRSTKAKASVSTLQPPSLSPSTRSSSASKRRSRPPAAASNPVLLYPRFPPEPQRFRAKSTYTTEFGRVR